MLYLTVLLGFLFFASVAMTINEGLWNNAVLLFCVILSGLFAILCGTPLSTWIIQKAEPSSSYVWCFVFGVIWVVFAFSITVIRLVAERASRIRVKFVAPLEMIAGPLMSLLVAVMFTSFSAYTLERVPIKAGEWDLRQATDSQRSTFQYARAPFLNVVKKFAVAEDVDTPFIAN